MISHDDDSLSLFAPSDVEDDLQREEGGPLREALFLVNNREPQSEGHTEELRKYCAKRQRNLIMKNYVTLKSILTSVTQLMKSRVKS